MILRRLTEHVKAQNWFAVAVDFVIVVAGVFVGIQVSNWNAAGADRGRAEGYLERIAADEALMGELAYWFSTMDVAARIGRDRVAAATEVKDAVIHEIGSSR